VTRYASGKFSKYDFYPEKSQKSDTLCFQRVTIYDSPPSDDRLNDAQGFIIDFF